MALSDLWTSQDSQGPTYGPMNLGQARGPYYDSIYNMQFNGALPDVLPNAGQNVGKNMAPNYTLGGINTAMTNAYDTDSFGNVRQRPMQGNFQQAPDEALRQTIQSANSGMINRGVGAFLGGGFQPWSLGSSPGMDGSSANYQSDAAQQWQQLGQLATGLGFDTSGYNTSTLRDLYNDMNDYTKDYYGVSGLASGWGPSQSGDMAARTLYKDDGTGTLRAVSQPRFYRNMNDDKAFIGRDSLTALSMVLPAFGGWAGLLGQGTAGTLSAGSGLGLTTGLGSTIGTGAANALVNAGMGALTNGSGGQGFLSGLFTQGLGAGLGSLTGGSNNLGSLFNTANAGSSALNPMGYFNTNMRNLGLGGSPLGTATQIPGGISRLQQLWGSL